MDDNYNKGDTGGVYVIFALVGAGLGYAAGMYINELLRRKREEKHYGEEKQMGEEKNESEEHAVPEKTLQESKEFWSNVDVVVTPTEVLEEAVEDENDVNFEYINYADLYNDVHGDGEVYMTDMEDDDIRYVVSDVVPNTLPKRTIRLMYFTDDDTTVQLREGRMIPVQNVDALIGEGTLDVILERTHNMGISTMYVLDKNDGTLYDVSISDTMVPTKREFGHKAGHRPIEGENNES